MKTKGKRFLVLALALALTFTLTLPVYAAGSNSSYGVYNVQVEDGYTLTPLTADGTEDTAVADDVGSVYKNTVKFTMSFAGEADAQYVVFLLNGETKVPTETNIRYIDQQGTDQTTVTVEFSIYPDTLAQAGKYAVCVSGSGTDGAYKTVASFNVVTFYSLGDVDLDGEITVSDASLVLQHVAQLITLDGARLAAANVDTDNEVTVSDASLILQRVAQLITAFPAEG